MGLKSNGTVVAVGWNDFGQCNISDWRDIIQAVSLCQCADNNIPNLARIVEPDINRNGIALQVVILVCSQAG